MEKKIIADTDVLIDYLDKSNDRHKRTVKIFENKEILISISSITVMELIVGAINKSHLNKINKELRGFLIILPNHEIALLSIRLLQQYHLSHGLKIQDCFIAATALFIDIPLFTYNIKDFKFIEGLELYDFNSL